MSTRKSGVRQGNGEEHWEGHTDSRLVDGAGAIYFSLFGLDTGGSPGGLPTCLPFLRSKAWVLL